MRFIEQSIQPENQFWKYILGFIVFISSMFIGQIPLGIAIFIKSLSENKSFPTTDKEMMTILDSNLTLFLILISFVFAFGGIYLAVKYINQQSFKEIVTARKKVDWNRILFSFSVWGIFAVLTTAYAYFSNPESYVFNFNLIPFLVLVVIGSLLIPIQTSTEEFVFRGYLMQGFGSLYFNKWAPLLTTSVLFGLMHIFNPEVEKMGYLIMIYYVGTGLFLGIITLMDDGIELCLGFHAANNLIGALLVTADWTVFQTHSILKDTSEPDILFDMILPVFIIYPILLFLFSKKYNWNNWKENLTGKIVENSSVDTI